MTRPKPQRVYYCTNIMPAKGVLVFVQESSPSSPSNGGRLLVAKFLLVENSFSATSFVNDILAAKRSTCVRFGHAHAARRRTVVESDVESKASE